MPTINPKEKLVAIYNLDRTNNGLQPILETEFDFGAPETYSGPRSTKNTRIYLTPKASSASVGRITLYYDRINLATITTLAVVKAAEVNVVDMLPKLNEELGITLVAADITNGVLPASGGFTLTASATNILYSGTTNVAYVS